MKNSRKKVSAKKVQIQQGDVTIERVNKLPSSAVRLNHLILAEGETTGHMHKINGGSVCEDAVLFEEKGDMYLQVIGNSVTLVHEEHNAQIIDKGVYKIGRVNEYDYDTEEARKVQD